MNKAKPSYRICIEPLLKERGISKNKICKDLDIPRTNFNRYCQNKIERFDLSLLYKLCNYLDVGVEEIIIIKSDSKWALLK